MRKAAHRSLLGVFEKRFREKGIQFTGTYYRKKWTQHMLQQCWASGTNALLPQKLSCHKKINPTQSIGLSVQIFTHGSGPVGSGFRPEEAKSAIRSPENKCFYIDYSGLFYFGMTDDARRGNAATVVGSKQGLKVTPGSEEKKKRRD